MADMTALLRKRARNRRVGKHIFLQRQKNAGRVDQVDRRNVIFDGDVLRPHHLLGRHGKERASLHGGVVGDQHEQSLLDAPQAGHDPAGRAAPLLVHLPRGISAQLEEGRSRIDQPRHALARRQAPFLCCASMALAPPPWRITSSSFATAQPGRRRPFGYVQKREESVFIFVSKGGVPGLLDVVGQNT